MITRHLPQKAKLICGFIYRTEEFYEKTIRILRKLFGPLDYETAAFLFKFTKYYNEEMGGPLYRRFVSFENLVASESFVKIKLRCINIERNLSFKSRRKINIDPGYIDLAKLVLFTTKDFSHRIHMGKGIYAEVTLRYIKGGFKDLDWTYPDYRTDEYKQFFIDIRNIYKNQIYRKKLLTHS
ncbi:MAG: hypothetical protein B1H08_04040 [Candidatus Omnitrophica bacterium 4484_171]|nr:MAG: hypothetical protein B1H08_04040 [Candidatus Omnitrophica bacterium 4484_171]